MEHYYHFLKQLNLNNSSELQAYLNENSSKLSAAKASHATLSAATISAELFKLFLTDLELKTFTHWDLTEVNFKQIKQDLITKNNQTVIDFDLFKELDLSYCNLTGVDLSGLDFSESNLIGANFKKALLNSTDLSGADLSHADLSDANLNYAKLVESVFTNATLADAKLNYCDARKGNFANANLQRCKFDTANLTEANFSDADISHANLMASNSQDVNFSRANLEFSSLKFANLARSNFRGANLDNAILVGSNLTDINLEGTSTNAVSISYDYVSYLTWFNLKTRSQQKYFPERYLNPQQSTQDKSVGLALLDRCLSTTKPRADDCKISWADIDSFSNGHYTCDVSQIVSNGRAFLWHFRSKDEPTQTQWLHIADVVNISSSAAPIIKNLIHFQKLSPLLNAAMQELESQSNQLKKNSLPDKLVESSALEWLDYFKKTAVNATYTFLNSSLLNTYEITMKTSDNSTNSFSYNVNIDFLTSEVRELLEIIPSLTMTKWPSTPETFIAFPLDLNFNQQQISWLRGNLSPIQFSQLLQKFPDTFNPCAQNCVNVTLSARNVIRQILLQLINPVSFGKTLESFNQNLTSIVPYQQALKFTDNFEMLLDEQENRYVYATRNQSFMGLIQAYTDLATRLKLRLVITNPVHKEMLSIGHQDQQVLQNHPNRKGHLVSNGDAKQFVIISGSTQLNISDFPLADVNIYANSNDAHPSVLDFRTLARQIRRNFNGSLSSVLSKQGNDIVLQRQLNLDEYEASATSVPVISVYLKNARVDRWYRNFDIFANTAKSQISLRGLSLQLIPMPWQVNVNNGSTDFINIVALEENTAIFISRKIENYSFFHSQGDLVLTNAWTSQLEINQLCNIVLQNFNLAPKKGFTLSLEFINRKIVLAEHFDKIINAQSWNDTLHQVKNTLFNAAYRQGQKPSLSVYRADCYHPPLINLRRLESYPDYYYQDDDTDYQLIRQRRSIPTSSSAGVSTGLLQNSFKFIKQSAQWLSNQAFSVNPITNQSYKKISAIHDESILQTAYDFHERYERKQQKHERACLSDNQNKSNVPIPAISRNYAAEKFSKTHSSPIKLKNKEKSFRDFTNTRGTRNSLGWEFHTHSFFLCNNV